MNGKRKDGFNRSDDVDDKLKTPPRELVGTPDRFATDANPTSSGSPRAVTYDPEPGGAGARISCGDADAARAKSPAEGRWEGSELVAEASKSTSDLEAARKKRGRHPPQSWRRLNLAVRRAEKARSRTR